MMSPEDVYKELWHCRDFELEHVWHRSIFLSAFLLGAYLAYGSCFMFAYEHALAATIANAVLCLIALLMFLLSCFWVMMAKGSKAWYEKWENAIHAYPEAFWGASLHGKVSGFRFENISGFIKPHKSDWLWNTEGGAYSPSRINIAIGHLSCVVSGLLVITHLIAGKFFLTGITFRDVFRMLQSVMAIDLVALIVVLCLLMFWIYVKRLLKSTTL